MECPVHHYPLTHICMRGLCNFALLCLKCTDEHHNHERIELQDVLNPDIQCGGRMELAPMEAIKQLERCDRSFDKVRVFLENVQLELRDQIESNELQGVFKAADVQSRFSQVCQSLQLETQSRDGKSEVVLRNCSSQWLRDCFNQLREAVEDFHREICLDIQMVVSKVSDFEKLVESQVRVLSALLLKDRMKASQGIQPLDNFKMATDCRLCPIDSLFQDEIVYDTNASFVMHHQCYLFNNCVRDERALCGVCGQAGAGVKCSECEVMIHYVCADKQQPQTFIVDKFEHRITCLKHVDQFYMVKVKQEHQLEWNLQQIESKSLSEEDLHIPQQQEIDQNYIQQQQILQQQYEPKYEPKVQPQPYEQKDLGGGGSFFKLKNPKALLVRWGISRATPTKLYKTRGRPRGRKNKPRD